MYLLTFQLEIVIMIFNGFVYGCVTPDIVTSHTILLYLFIRTKMVWHKTKKITWGLFVISCVLIGLYPLIYFTVDRQFGLLGSKSDELLNDLFWNIGFYGHIMLGGLALLIGWIQFVKKIRTSNIKLHRSIGKVYTVSVLLSALTGIYIGFFATGGIIASTGFVSLGIIWFYTTLRAYISVRQKDIEDHEMMMIYSYAACFAAVTLRIWLPLLTMTFQDFIIAYKIVAWLAWIPNLIVAYFIIRYKQRNQLATTT